MIYTIIKEPYEIHQWKFNECFLVIDTAFNVFSFGENTFIVL